MQLGKAKLAGQMAQVNQWSQIDIQSPRASSNRDEFMLLNTDFLNFYYNSQFYLL
jgi:hypothetical protein